jgi:hypothetical protein
MLKVLFRAGLRSDLVSLAAESIVAQERKINWDFSNSIKFLTYN